MLPLYRIKVTSISDHSVYGGSDNDFTIIETFTSPLAGCLILEGPDDFLEALDHPELNLGDDLGERFTIEGWFYETGYYHTGSIVTKPDSYSLGVRRYYDFSQGFTMSCTYFDLEIQPDDFGTRSLCRWPPRSVGWHHVALVGDSGLVRLYLDGELETEAEYSGSLVDSTENLKAGEGLRGAVDEIRISDVARYSDSSFIPRTSPFTCDGHTRALWHFDEPEGSTHFHDACGADNILSKNCTGDFDGDKDVDGSDLAVFAADFGRTYCSGDCEGDFDGDNDVDGSDLAVFAADFGRTDCP